MQRFEVNLADSSTPVDQQVVTAFVENTHILAVGEKFGQTQQFELSVYQVTGTKRDLSSHVLRFAGIEHAANKHYVATAQEPSEPDATVSLAILEPSDTLETITD